MAKCLFITLEHSLTGQYKLSGDSAQLAHIQLGKAPSAVAQSFSPLDVKRTEGLRSPQTAGSMTNCPKSESRDWLILLGSVGLLHCLKGNLPQFDRQSFCFNYLKSMLNKVPKSCPFFLQNASDVLPSSPSGPYFLMSVLGQHLSNLLSLPFPYGSSKDLTLYPITSCPISSHQ